MEGGTPDSTMGKGAGTSTPKESTKADNRTDLTGGQEGVPENYADTPVRQGKLVEARDHKYKNATVHSSQGEAIGKIKELLKDTKTGEIEYAVFVPDESKRMPYPSFHGFELEVLEQPDMKIRQVYDRLGRPPRRPHPCIFRASLEMMAAKRIHLSKKNRVVPCSVGQIRQKLTHAVGKVSKCAKCCGRTSRPLVRVQGSRRIVCQCAAR